MKAKNRYRSVLNKSGFSYQEIKRINQLLVEDTPKAEIKRLVFEENILQQTSFDMQRRIWKEIEHRLQTLDKEAMQLLSSQDRESSSALVLYSILQIDLLFLEFSRTVYLDKLLTFHYEITKKEVIRFIENQIIKDEKAKKWSTSTINKLAGTYLRILMEVGMLSRDHQIQRLVLSPETENYLREKGYQPSVEVVLGELL